MFDIEEFIAFKEFFYEGCGVVREVEGPFNVFKGFGESDGVFFSPSVRVVFIKFGLEVVGWVDVEEGFFGVVSFDAGFEVEVFHDDFLESVLDLFESIFECIPVKAGAFRSSEKIEPKVSGGADKEGVLDGT